MATMISQCFDFFVSGTIGCNNIPHAVRSKSRPICRSAICLQLSLFLTFLQVKCTKEKLVVCLMSLNLWWP